MTDTSCDKRGHIMSPVSPRCVVCGVFSSQMMLVTREVYESLTARLAEAEKRKKQDAHLYIKAMNTIVDLEDRLVAVMDERDELLQQLIDLGGLR
jgi:hypothetical protein